MTELLQQIFSVILRHTSKKLKLGWWLGSMHLVLTALVDWTLKMEKYDHELEGTDLNALNY